MTSLRPTSHLHPKNHLHTVSNKDPEFNSKADFYTHSYSQHPHHHHHHNHPPPHPPYHPHQTHQHSSPAPPSIQPTSAPMAPSADVEDEEMVVIGSAVGDTFQSNRRTFRPAFPTALPNLRYDHPEASVENFSPGTSLVFNAYRGHQSLLTQPNIPTGYNEDDGHGLVQRHSPAYSRPHPLAHPPSHPFPHSHPPNSPQHRHPQQQQQQEQQQHHHQREHQHQHHSNIPMDPHHDNQRYLYLDKSDHRNFKHQEDPRDFRDLRDLDDAPTHIPIPSRPIGPMHPSREAHSAAIDRAYHIHGRGEDAHVLDIDPSLDRMGARPRPPEQLPRYGQEEQDRFGQASFSEPSVENQRVYPAPIDIPQQSYPAGRVSEGGHFSGPHPQAHPQPHPTQDRRPSGPRYNLTQTNYRMIYEYASEIRDCLTQGKIGTTDRLLYSAEILSKVFMGCRLDQEILEPPEEEAVQNPHQLRCTSCNIVKTPEWRKGPLGPRTLCNACGLIWGKMSRSKAALAAQNNSQPAAPDPGSQPAGTEAPVPEPPTTSTEGHGPQASSSSTTATPQTPTDGSRKRGRSTTEKHQEEVEGNHSKIRSRGKGSEVYPATSRVSLASSSYPSKDVGPLSPISIAGQEASRDSKSTGFHSGATPLQSKYQDPPPLGPLDLDTTLESGPRARAVPHSHQSPGHSSSNHPLEQQDVRSQNLTSKRVAKHKELAPHLLTTTDLENHDTDASPASATGKLSLSYLLV